MSFEKVWDRRQVNSDERTVSNQRIGKSLLDTSTATASVYSEFPAKVAAGMSSDGSGSGFTTMLLEAKSAKDGAWYDLDSVVSYRRGTTGDPEVQVRFAGFSANDDEWVDVYSSLRQRSLPCEESDCVHVLPGDLVLCFQEGPRHALHYDADVLDVKRRRHDAKGCRCRFLVRYRHDDILEILPLRKICRRPETELRALFCKQRACPSRTMTAGATPVVLDMSCRQTVLETTLPDTSTVLVVTSDGLPQAIIYCHIETANNVWRLQ